MKVVIIGSGNTATVLGKKMKAAGHEIVQVFGRNATAAEILSQHLNAQAVTNANDIYHSSDIYIVALADSSLPALHEWLRLDKKLVVHTAAAVSKHVLKNVSKNYGVLYPLQTLRKEQSHIPEMPFLVDGNTADDLALIEDFAATLSSRVMPADDDMRLRVHVAAVFANNFTNHLYALAEDFCKKGNVDFSLLLPLIDETARRIHTLPPQNSQTGPAIRNDVATIKKHLEVLKPYAHLREVYEKLSESVRGWRVKS
jgi:predicted short-subunit dehydrogenase-like oxidoreductase (DUF2520 family)